jgi:hypothetical protein
LIIKTDAINKELKCNLLVAAMTWSIAFLVFGGEETFHQNLTVIKKIIIFTND